MRFLKKTLLAITLIIFTLPCLSAQSPPLQDSFDILIEKGIQLDDKDHAWLSVQENRTKIFSAISTEIKEDDLPLIQIMIKLFSNELFDLTDEEIEANDALLTKIIHGTFDQFGKEEYKMMSATTWYGIFKTQAEANSKKNKSYNMSFFKKIFGKPDKEKDKQVEEDIAHIKAGEIKKIYPILKPGNWVGIKAGAIRQTLLGTPEEPILVAGFGYDTPSNFIFLTTKDIEGKDTAKIVEEAYANLDVIQIEFSTVEQLGGTILTASGNDFSSEKIFSQKHMLKAHELLQTDELLVSIPRRRCMMVVSKSADQKLLDLFIALHKKAWQEDDYGNAPIINALFLVKDGSVNNVIGLD